jgi:hypothetical protein
MNNLERLEKLLGKERLTRVMEVLNILGGELPNELPDKLDVNNGEILLPKTQKCINGEIGLEGILTSIILDNGKYRYHWHIMLCDNGSIQENLSIDYGNLEATFYTTNIATNTSGFYLYNDTWGSPKIYADLLNVEVYGRKDQIYPVEEYFNVVTSYMKSKKTNGYYKNDLRDDPEVIDIILKLYEKPIKDHINYLKNIDQSWRFEAESKKIMENYDEDIEDAQKTYDEDVEDAKKRLDYDKEHAENYKNTLLSELEELQQKYENKNGKSL